MAEWWHDKPLNELSDTEWEALCDGCAKCCLHKPEDDESGEVYYTKVRCRYLDEQTCRCTGYANRSVLVPHCIQLREDDVHTLDWLPSTCAYRLRADGQPLPEWHPLVSGDANTVHRAGVSIRGRAISDEYVHPDGFDEHIVHWVE
ncbi:MAG: YcgN family cysteine cluster protein [Gammaproteobacteria bacterium]|nr:MAG: YcgN family cysteine cluster protein [Gammaproteobacteria bacterium]